MIRSALEEALDVELVWNRKKFDMVRGSLEGVDVPAQALQHPLLQVFHEIVKLDYGLGMFTVPAHMNGLDNLSDWAYSTSLHVIEPAIVAPVQAFPDMEAVSFNALKVPPGTLYQFHQVFSANSLARELFKERKTRGNR
ncbi:hypothetical protein COY87_03410 [Candidatus Roizmanbacteria bacterium CG_4_10_14_0_8_um_filter_33_9]|uniref:Uncharacterized protein n=1 Tax=Candidatus Roizmanbacteria bacterium CG_4_10_14_0_8_um_filter_33_9 TaxID=1974826 RepID=A0A2M7QJC3_9BACT|nr:MAG: hypothetical protein COY87_03410 [Candidatus Roizmanbacteria bacterium CG_4_10_14_0_8_um_filter_33_9]